MVKSRCVSSVIVWVYLEKGRIEGKMLLKFIIKANILHPLSFSSHKNRRDRSFRNEEKFANK
jgi:hypothetical protein